MIFDCFLFLNELDILKKRLEYLKDTVDVFVLVESTRTFSGNSKELIFENNKEKFKDYNIRHVIVNDLPNEEIGWGSKYGRNGIVWDREFYNRHGIMRALHDDVNDDDIILLSDIDEIPKKEYIRDYGDKIIGLHMTHFEFSLKTIQTHEPWIGTVISKFKMFKDHGPNFFRFNRWRFFILKEAGWHFSSFGGSNNVYYKHQSYAHCNDQGVNERDEDFYKNMIQTNTCANGKNKLTIVTDEILNNVPTIFHNLS